MSEDKFTFLDLDLDFDLFELVGDIFSILGQLPYPSLVCIFILGQAAEMLG